MPLFHINQSQMTALLNVTTSSIGAAKAISGAAALSGVVNLSATAHGYATGQNVVVLGVTGTTEANGVWTATVVDANHFTIPVAFVNAYVSGGNAYAATFASGLVSGLYKHDLHNLTDSANRAPNNPSATIGTLLAVAP